MAKSSWCFFVWKLILFQKKYNIDYFFVSYIFLPVIIHMSLVGAQRMFQRKEDTWVLSEWEKKTISIFEVSIANRFLLPQFKVSYRSWNKSWLMYTSAHRMEIGIVTSNSNSIILVHNSSAELERETRGRKFMQNRDSLWSWKDLRHKWVRSEYLHQ